MITKEEWEEWKSSKTTKELAIYITEQIEMATNTLIDEAGVNSIADRELVGGIGAFRDVLEWKPDFGESE